MKRPSLAPVIILRVTSREVRDAIHARFTDIVRVISDASGVR